MSIAGVLVIANESPEAEQSGRRLGLCFSLTHRELAMKTVSIIFAATLVFALQGGSTDARADTGYSAHCTGMNVSDSFSSYAVDQTKSTTNWINVTDAHVTFTTSATGGCATVTFSGLVSISVISPYGEALHLRTLLDGKSLCEPATTVDIFYYAPQEPAPEIAATATRICRNLAAGTHTLQVQYKGDLGGGVQIAGHELIVTHN
jgi:hypothetical protein